MRDRPGGRGFEPPLAREDAQRARESPDSMKQRLGRLSTEHPSSPHYREGLPSVGRGDRVGAPGNRDRGAAPARREWPLFGRVLDSRAGGGEPPASPRGERGEPPSGRRAQGGEPHAGPRGRGGPERGTERRDGPGDARGAPWWRSPDRQVGGDRQRRAERLAARRGGDGGAPPRWRSGATARSADRTRGEGKEQGSRTGRGGQPARLARRHQGDRRDWGDMRRLKAQRRQGDQSAVGGSPQPRKSPYRPWFASTGEGPQGRPWFAASSGTGDAGGP